MSETRHIKVVVPEALFTPALRCCDAPKFSVYVALDGKRGSRFCTSCGYQEQWDEAQLAELGILVELAAELDV